MRHLKQAQHTPGPWTVDTMYTVDVITDRLHREDIRSVCSVQLRDNGGVIVGTEADAVNKANAALISAAPDLLEALRDARATLMLNGCIAGSGTWGKVNAAINKAEGRKP